MADASPLAHQDGARADISGRSARRPQPALPAAQANRIVEQASALGIEIAEMIGLQPVGEHAEQKVPRQVRRRLPAEDIAASEPAAR